MADGSAADPGSHEPGSSGRRPAATDHDERHDLAIASLLDPDLPDDERHAAERLVETCPPCAALHADLLALAAATRGLPVPARPRNFWLTAEHALRLAPAGVVSGEPHAAAARLTGEMQVPDTDHRTHDAVLIAGLLDRSTPDLQRERAEALLAACTECAALHVDLLDLRAATRALPTPGRVRDYAITPAAAERLRRTGWRRLIAVFGSTRDAFSRPLAIGLTTIGLAGLLVTTVPGALPGATSTASVPTLGQGAGDAAAGANPESVGGAKEAPGPSPAPSAPGPAAAVLIAPSGGPSDAVAPVAASRAPAPSDPTSNTYLAAPVASPGTAAIAPAPSGPTGPEGAERTAVTSVAAAPATVDHVALVALAGLLFAAGLGLFVLRWAGRRV